MMICEQCHNSFERRRGRIPRFCSDACRMSYHIARGRQLDMQNQADGLCASRCGQPKAPGLSRCMKHARKAVIAERKRMGYVGTYKKARSSPMRNEAILASAQAEYRIVCESSEEWLFARAWMGDHIDLWDEKRDIVLGRTVPINEVIL